MPVVDSGNADRTAKCAAKLILLECALERSVGTEDEIVQLSERISRLERVVLHVIVGLSMPFIRSGFYSDVHLAGALPVLSRVKAGLNLHFLDGEFRGSAGNTAEKGVVITDAID